MDGLQTLLDNSSTPVLTAFLLGLLTALSPCPLATNIAAISFIGKEMEDRKRVFRNGLLYTLGRILAYTLLGFVLILILNEGSSMFGIQKTIGTWGERVLGPALFVIGLFMFFGDRLNLPQFGFKGNAEGLARKGGWGSPADRRTLCVGFLPHERCALFRYADTPVGYHHSRLSAACRVRHSHGPTGTCGGLDTGIQRATSGPFIWQDAYSTAMDEPVCRGAFHRYRHLL